MRRYRIALSLCLPSLCLPLAAHAQPAPDAGSLLQEIERSQPSTLPGKRAPLPPLPQEMQAPSGAHVMVKSFRFVGNTLLTNEELAAVVAPYRDRSLNFAQLQAAAADVAKAYRAAGWIVRAYLPKQDVTDGAITIQIVEAVFGGALIEGAAAQRVARERLLDIVAAQQRAGEPLNADAIDRTLMLLDDLPGVSVAGALREGARERETQLLLKLTDEPPMVGEFGLDNTGSRSTGRERLTANVNLNSPFGQGESFSANALLTRGSDYMRVGASLPVGNDGWRLGANASHLRYKVITDDFKALDIHGSSDSLAIDANYPIIRSRLGNLYFNAGLEQKSFDNRARNLNTGSIDPTTRYKLETVTLGLMGNLFDSLGGGGANSASVSLIQGDLNLEGSPNQAADAAGARTNGSYNKWRYALSRQQALSEGLSLYAAYSGQRASKNLDSSEKFYLGGASGVRAYPSSEGGGAHGELLTVELRYRLDPRTVLTAFHDSGRVTVNRNEFAVPPSLNNYSLRGSGVAVAWQGESGLNLKLVWARRDGGNLNPTATGNDQDGSRIKDRIWLTATLPF
ncbi:MAG TPA: ShlB/FhaC/HecB family hemolysin secretion/activation protein [Rhodocyclaceae bacterium]|nr:ShlB/FhaC/HecB family hemolysin secretion/activation protein [Rhodocyclaceae bacterium]